MPGKGWTDDRVYAVYRGDEFVTIGTRAELAERLGVDEDTIRRYARPSWRGRFQAYLVEEDDE